LEQIQARGLYNNVLTVFTMPKKPKQGKKKQILITIPEALHSEFKAAAAERGESMRAAIVAAVRRYTAKFAPKKTEATTDTDA